MQNRKHVVGVRLNAREKRALDALLLASDTISYGEWVRQQIVEQATEMDLIAPPAETQLSADELHIVEVMNLDAESYLEVKRQIENDRQAAAAKLSYAGEKLTDAEKRQAEKMGIPEERYQAQRDQVRKARKPSQNGTGDADDDSA